MPWKPCKACQGRTLATPGLDGLVTCSACGLLQVGTEEQLMAEALVVPDGKLVHEPENAYVVDVPDYTDVMIGWRTWSIAMDAWDPYSPNPIMLRSITHNEMVWPPRQRVEAVCNKGRGRKNGQNPVGAHQAPYPSCRCGLYSAKTRAHLFSLKNEYHKYNVADGHVKVVGQVSNWGIIQEATQGWRAQYSYPLELFLPYEAWRLAKPITEEYGVSVRLDNILGD